MEDTTATDADIKDPPALDGETMTLKLPDVPPAENSKDEKSQEQDSKNVNGDLSSAAGKAVKPPSPPPRYPTDEFDDLLKRFEALKKR